MKNKTPKNISASIRQRLLNISKEKKEDFGLVLTRYALERFLYRLGKSSYKKSFILKGALLFWVWGENSYRPTRDADFLAHGDDSLDHLKKVIQEMCTIEVSDDGMFYLANTVQVLRLKEGEEYQGARVTFVGKLTEAKIAMQIDIGFGDVVTPKPKEITYPTLLKIEPPTLKAYPQETVISEKLQAMVMLGIANSRMKDFYDIWLMSNQFAFDGALLSEAIQKTFERRKTEIPKKLPFALTAEFYDTPIKQSQWSAFIQKNKLVPDGSIKFSETINQIKRFLMPLLESLTQEKEFKKKWVPNKGWHT